MSFVIGVLAFIFILGTAVILHEFGHFIVAKLLRMRVETFSVGFGPRLFGHRWGPTDYRVSLIPLGGYVKLGGDESNAAIEGASASNIPAAERFDLRPRWQKFLVMVAGPVMNILTALTVVFVSALLNGVPAVPTSPVVSRIAPGGAAEIAGLRPGDQIVSFNGKEHPTWERVRNDALISPEQPLPMIVERNGQRIPLTIKPTKRTEDGESIGEIDFRPDYGNLPVTIISVLKDSPASEAGLQAGDHIISISGETIRDEQDVRDAIQAHKAEPIRLTIERNGERREIVASVRRMPDGKEQLGILSGTEEPLQNVGLFSAAAYALHRNIEVLRMTGNALSQIFSGRRSARDSLSGPIGIGRAASTAANRGGWGGVFGMLGFLSLNLGVINLLPIPVLDGGAIFLLLVEAILGWIGVKLSMTMRERIQQVGFVVLLLLMGFVITNDLVKEYSHWNNRPAATATPQK